MHPVLDLKYWMKADGEQKERVSDISSIVLSVQVRWYLISTISVSAIQSLMVRPVCWCMILERYVCLRPDLVSDKQTAQRAFAASSPR